MKTLKPIFARRTNGMERSAVVRTVTAFNGNGTEPYGHNSRTQDVIDPSIILSTDAIEKGGVMLKKTRENKKRIEEFKVIQVNLRRLLRKKSITNPNEGHVILVTSPEIVKNEGFVATNLAISICKWGKKRIIMIDGDREYQTATKRFGCENQSGLFDAEENPNTIDWDAIIIQTEIENFYFLPAGLRKEDDPEATGIRSITQIISEIKKWNPDSFIVVHCPSCLTNSDAILLSEVADSTIVVVEAMKTKTNDLERAITMLEDCKNLGVIMNEIPGKSYISNRNPNT